MGFAHTNFRLRVLATAACAGVLLYLAATAFAASRPPTTAQSTIVQGGNLDPAKPGFRALTYGPGTKLYVRGLPGARAQDGRSRRRLSLSYFAYLTDIHVADEESPVRFDSFGPSRSNTSSWRPQEALQPQTIDATLQGLSAFAGASPNTGAKGRRAKMDMALLGGDQVDNDQANEVTWVRQLLEGGQSLDPNSGISDYRSCTPAQRLELAQRPADEASRYTGIQDYSDYNNGQGDPSFYDPDDPVGAFASWPRYAGLLDAAQRPFVPTGLRDGKKPVPTYVTVGNHDGSPGGYYRADADAEALAVGCEKPYRNATLSPDAGEFQYAVPPDPARHFVGPAEMKQIYESGSQADGHGFRFVDPAQNAASRGTAAYYAWTPKRGLRFISLDTLAEGNQLRKGAEGNIDNPQFQWLRGELRRAKAAHQLVIVFGHHPIRRLIASRPDEALGGCVGSNTLGCDGDPRTSSPIHLKDSLIKLFNQNANVVAYLAGHTHINRIRPCNDRCSRAGNWWSVETTSSSDFPQQQRLFELMDNKDGTLSLLATPVDHPGGVALPPPTADPAVTNAFSIDQLAAIGRDLSANDPRQYKNPSGGVGDRNVELIVRNPFAGKGAGLCAAPFKKVTSRTTDRSVLGRARIANRKNYPPASLTARTKAVDRFCLVGGGYARSGYPTPALLRTLSARERRRVSGRTILSITSSKTTRLMGIRVGSSTKTVTHRLHGEQRFSRDGSTFYLARASRSRILVQVRHGKVVQLGLADSRLTAGAKRAKLFIGALF